MRLGILCGLNEKLKQPNFPLVVELQDPEIVFGGPKFVLLVFEICSNFFISKDIILLLTVFIMNYTVISSCTSILFQLENHLPSKCTWKCYLKFKLNCPKKFLEVEQQLCKASSQYVIKYEAKSFKGLYNGKYLPGEGGIISRCH